LSPVITIIAQHILISVLFHNCRMSLIGHSCMILPVGGPWKMAVIRAASQPLLSNSDLTQIRVRSLNGVTLVGWVSCGRLESAVASGCYSSFSRLT
jgi:hypothetical protein